MSESGDEGGASVPTHPLHNPRPYTILMMFGDRLR